MALRTRCIHVLCAGVVAYGALAGPVPARADSSLEHELQLWAPIYLTFPVSGDVKGYFEVNPRAGDELTGMSQLLIRPAVGYQLTGEMSVWQGYAWVTNYVPRVRTEHRAFQQFIYAMAFPRVRMLSRSRLEERFVEDAQGVSLRARTMLRADFEVFGSEAWALAVYDEMFVNLNTIRNGPEGGFDQNRFFVGVNRRLTPVVSMDLGYQMQLLNTERSGLANQVNHVILIQTFMNW